MLDELAELWKYRELLVSMVQRELKIRYKNSAFGFLWSLLNPLITVLVLTFVITNVIRPNAPGSTSAYVLASYLPFVFFQLCVMDSAQSILGAMPLIKKIYFPREILPIATVLSNFIHLVLAMGVFFLYLLLAYIVHPGEWPFQIGSLYLPLLLLISFCLALGCAFYVSALNTFYEDVKYIAGVGLWLLFFVTPIMYFSEDVANSRLNDGAHTHGWFYILFNLNPLSALASAYRKTLLAPPRLTSPTGGILPFSPLNWKYLIISAVLALFLLISGYATFNRLKWRFVERP